MGPRLNKRAHTSLRVLQVYSWGSNMCGQLGHVSSPVTVPQQTKVHSHGHRGHMFIYFLTCLFCCFFLHKFAVCTLAVRRSSGLGRVCRSEPLPPPGGWRLRPAGPVVLWPAARAKAAAESKLVPAVTQQSGELRSQTHPPAPLLGGSYIRKHKPWFSFSRTDIEEEEG